MWAGIALELLYQGVGVRIALDVRVVASGPSPISGLILLIAGDRAPNPDSS